MAIDSAPVERRCPGKTREGEACKAPPHLLLGDGWCYSHSPDPAVKADREAARTRGGDTTARRYNGTKGLNENDLGPLESPGDAARWTREVALAVAVGRLTASQGQSITRAIQLFLKAHEAGETTARLADLEAKVREIMKARGRAGRV